MGQEKQKLREEEKRKRKSQDSCVTFKPKKTVSKFLLSVHAQTLEAGVLCLEQKASKCLTYK